MTEESIENISKSDISFSLTFVNIYILPDKNFNGLYLMNNINNNIYS